MKPTYYILICCLLVLIGCKKDEEDGRGVTTIDTYLVNDSVVDPFQTWHFNSYTIKVSNNSANPNEILITNYLGNGKETVGQVSGNSITIIGQPVNEDGSQIQQSHGYFSNDSIFIHMSYLASLGDPYYGDCWGKKN
jgi:hypothetical protein